MIKIRAEHIKNKLGPSHYLLIGSDPYLRYYAQTELQKNFRQLGFDDQFIFTVDPQMDWQTVYECCQTMNLFSSKTLIL